jgi:hypothetical protein
LAALVAAVEVVVGVLLPPPVLVLVLELVLVLVAVCPRI